MIEYIMNNNKDSDNKYQRPLCNSKDPKLLKNILETTKRQNEEIKKSNSNNYSQQLLNLLKDNNPKK